MPEQRRLERPRARRSVLYMPGSNERALAKAATIPADALIFDLEDAVGPDAKADARERACAAVSAGGYAGREVAIRVNGTGTEWHEADLAGAARSGADAVLVPKVDSAGTVTALEEALRDAGAPEHTALWAMLETPAAMLDAAEIAAASSRLTVLVLGTNDLAAELRAEPAPDRAPLLGGLSLALLAARAHGKVLLDGVFNDVGDLEGFEAECAQGRRFGFDGKTLIHPSQVEPCNRIFAPSAEEIRRANRIIEAFDEATRAGQGVAVVDGQMVEHLHVAGARRVLALAEAVAAGETDSGPGD